MNAIGPESTRTDISVMQPLIQKKVMKAAMDTCSCKTCAMVCRYFTRIECEKRGHVYWEPRDRSVCDNCIAWHPAKKVCFRHDEPCRASCSSGMVGAARDQP
nr:hypothetical protein [Candidatus Sigynarchaeota archaeon]